MTRTITCCVLVCIILSNPAARADFVIRNDPATGEGRGAPQSAVAGGVIADDPHVDPADSEPPARPRPVAVRPRLVEGFGEQVPLSFACRQIVPGNIKVTFGPGVDPATHVSWNGGETWRVVLGRAITPLGLHIVVAGMSLTIKR